MGGTIAVFNSFIVCCLHYYMSDAISFPTRFSRVDHFSYHPKVAPYALSIFLSIVFPHGDHVMLVPWWSNQIYVQQELKRLFLKYEKELLHA